MNKKVLILTITALSILSCHQGLANFSKPTFHPSTTPNPIDVTKPKILLVCPVNGLGGAELHVVSLYKQLRNHQYDVSLLVGHNSALSHLLTKQDLPFYDTTANYFKGITRPLYHIVMKRCLKTLCKKHHFAIIHCHTRADAKNTVQIAHKYGAKAIMTRHIPDALPIKKIKNMDAIIGPTPAITSHIAKQNKQHNLGIKLITNIPEFFEDEKFLTFKTTTNKTAFFKEAFGITINNDPVLVMIANLYNDLTHKNHPLLFKAIAKLINQKHKPVQVMLAGDGAQRGYLTKLAKELGIDQYIHFLGFTNKIPELLYHADILVHSASKEAFGIIYLEAGAMKKPAIGARETGAEIIIIDEQTGLLFKNNDVNDLVLKIEQLLDKPLWAKALGENAYQHIIKNFSPASTFALHEALYQKVLGLSPLK